MKKLLLLSLFLCGCSAAYRQRKAVEKLDALAIQQPNEFGRLSNMLNPCFSGKVKSDTVISLHTDTLLQGGKTDTLVKNNTVYVTKTVPVKTVKTVTIHDTIADGRANKQLIIALAIKSDSLINRNTLLGKSEKETNTWRWAAIIAILIIFCYVVVKVYALISGGWIKKLLPIVLVFMAFGANAQQQVIKHHSYTIYYNPAIKAPDSTSFDLSPSQVSCASVKRIDKFAPDPLLKNGPKVSDFKNTTKIDSLQIDKGHTFSYNSSHCSPIDRVECFYVDGMYAQYHGYNNGDWKEFEEYEQSLATKQTIHVINGYIGIQGRLEAGEIIPAYMYKAIYHDGAYEVFIAPNRPWVHGHNIAVWKRNVTDLNKLTGLRLK